MVQKSKKIILISAELINSAVGIFYKDLGFELHTEFIPESSYEFIINDHFPELKEFPRIQIAPEISNECRSQVRGVVDELAYTHPLTKKLLQTFFNDAQELDIVGRYSKALKKVYLYKIHEYLNVGYFIDSVIIHAYKAQFDIDRIRSFLNILMKFSFRRLEKSQKHHPLDLSYSHDGKAFAIQVTLTVSDFQGKGEIEELRKECQIHCNFFDVTYFGKKNQVSISSVMFKDQKISSSKIYFYNEIIGKTLKGDKKTDYFSALKVRGDTKYNAEKFEGLRNKKLMIARKFTSYIINIRKTEENAKDLESLEVSDVINYLSNYDKKDKLALVDEEVQNFILRLLKDGHLNKSITNYIGKVSKASLDSQIEEIQKNLVEKTIDDIEEIFNLKVGEFGESVQNNKKWQDILKVKSIEESIDDSVSEEEYWEIKKLEINKKIEEEVIKNNSQGRNVVESDILRVMAKTLGAEEEEVEFIVKSIIEEALTSELVKGQLLEEAPALKLLSERVSDAAKEKLEHQNLKMKRVMQQMKNEIMRIQNEKFIPTIDVESQSVLNHAEGEINQLKAGMNKNIEALKGKEKLIEKQKNDFESSIRSRDKKINSLEKRIEEMKGEYVRSKDFANAEKLKILEIENKTLLSRIELVNKQVNTFNENAANKDGEDNERKSKEIETLKMNINMAEITVDQMKQEKADLESLLAKEGIFISAGRITKSEVANEMEAKLKTLGDEKKILEEKYRSLSLEFKKVEQKLKFTTSQLEASGKRKDVNGTQSQKTADAYAKQLEQAYVRLNESTEELAEKKKELLKKKQDLNILTTKVAELERKLAIAEKKAA